MPSPQLSTIKRIRSLAFRVSSLYATVMRRGNKPAFQNALSYNFASGLTSCFLGNNLPPHNPNAKNFNVSYCYYAPLLQTQQTFDIPVSPTGNEAFMVYADYDHVAAEFQELIRTATVGGVFWDPKHTFPPIPAALQVSTSNVHFYTIPNVVSPPIYNGYASAVDTTSTCPSGKP